MKKKNMGSPFDSWLREEGIYEEVKASAIKRVVARQLAAAVKDKREPATSLQDHRQSPRVFAALNARRKRTFGSLG